MAAPFVVLNAGAVRGMVQKVNGALDQAQARVLEATKQAMNEISHDIIADAQSRINNRSGGTSERATVEEVVVSGEEISQRFGFNVRHGRQLDQGGEILPVKGKLLAIPLDPVLTAAGVARYSSPLEEPDLVLVKINGKLFLVKRDERGGRFKGRDLLRFHWQLVPSVEQPGTKFFSGAVDARKADVPRVIGDRVGQLLGGGGAR